MEKLTYQEKAKLKQLIHNVLQSTKISNAITESIVEQRNKIGLEEAVVNRYKIELRLKIRDIEVKNKQETILM